MEVVFSDPKEFPASKNVIAYVEIFLEESMPKNLSSTESHNLKSFLYFFYLIIIYIITFKDLKIKWCEANQPIFLQFYRLNKIK